MSASWTFDHQAAPSWPRLAWLAVCPAGGRRITVHVGADVETHDRWFGEATWDGDFGEGRLDETDLVFGSGARIRGDDVLFVSSGTTLDRLHSHRTPAGLLVSNSLACLMAATGGGLLVPHDYFPVFGSIRDGLSSYDRHLPTSIGDVTLTYFDNLSWDGETERAEAKPMIRRDLSTFGRYEAFLLETLRRLADNMGDGRRTPAYRMLSTISSGYDSATITALARDVGCRETIGFDRARTGTSDSGVAIAAALGVEHHGFPTDRWRSTPLAEVPFLATGVGGGGSVPFVAAEPLLRNRVLLTGFHAGPVWNRRADHVSDDIVRSDRSGGDLVEYRLSAGFLHCAPAFFAVRQAADVNRISNSREMRRWNLETRSGAWGHWPPQRRSGYNRPICRRILEERGVGRHLFGRRKAAIAQRLMAPDQILGESSRPAYAEWLDRRLAPDVRRRIADRLGEGLPPGLLTAWALELETGRYLADGPPVRSGAPRVPGLP